MLIETLSHEKPPHNYTKSFAVKQKLSAIARNFDQHINTESALLDASSDVIFTTNCTFNNNRIFS